MASHLDLWIYSACFSPPQKRTILCWKRLLPRTDISECVDICVLDVRNIFKKLFAWFIRKAIWARSSSKHWNTEYEWSIKYENNKLISYIVWCILFISVRVDCGLYYYCCLTLILYIVFGPRCGCQPLSNFCCLYYVVLIFE